MDRPYSSTSIMSSRRPPLPRPPRRRAANLFYDCSMLQGDETVFLLQANLSRRFSARDQAAAEQIRRIHPSLNHASDPSATLNPLRRQRVFGGWAVPAEAIAKYIDMRAVVRPPRQNDGVGGEGGDGLCVVCQDDLCGRIARLDCWHEYHVNCINKWLNFRNSCPLCNAAVIPAASFGLI